VSSQCISQLAGPPLFPNAGFNQGLARARGRTACFAHKAQRSGPLALLGQTSGLVT
jgi:hypothetical protein